MTTNTNTNIDAILATARPLALMEVPASSPTPECNTGVESAKPFKEGFIDWLRFVVPDAEKLQHFLEYYGGSKENWHEGKGAMFYQKGYRNGNITIYTDNPEPNTGILVQLSGQGCRQLESMRWFQSWRIHLERLTLDHAARFTRCDVALDDRAGVLSMPTIMQAARVGDYSCRGGRKIIESHERGRLLPGVQVEFGARSSTAMMRFYDKAAEQESKGVRVLGHWVRAEYEAKAERAHLLVSAIIEQGLACVPGILRGFIEFTDPDSAVIQKCRRSEVAWWSEFLGGWERLRLVMAPAVRTYQKTLAWIETSVAPSLAMVALANREGQAFIRELVNDGQQRLRPSHMAMIRIERARFDKYLSGAVAGPTGF